MLVGTTESSSPANVPALLLSSIPTTRTSSITTTLPPLAIQINQGRGQDCSIWARESDIWSHRGCLQGAWIGQWWRIFRGRVEYDLSGEALREKFTTLFVARYGDDKLFSERAKEITTALDRAMIFKQGVATKIINKELQVMEQICKHWCKTGQQTNVVCLLISEALGNRIEKSDISQFVRANVFNDKWHQCAK